MTLPRRTGAACAGKLLAALLALLMATHAAAQSQSQSRSQWDGVVTVPRAEVVRALREQQAAGYRLDAIANSVRLQVGVFLALADAARAADPLQRPLRVNQDDWFAAWTEVTGIAPQAAPAWITAPHRIGEDHLIDYRIDRVIDVAASKPRPLRALAVKAGWPAVPGAPASYAYEDRSTDPAIETTRAQVTSFRVLDFGSAVVYDDIRGVGGRATSGLLGAIFGLIGHAQAVQTRFAVAADGWQVSRTTARKGLTLTQSIAIRPDGTVFAFIPEDRSDLEAIDRTLARMALEIVYLPIDRAPMPARQP